MPASDAPSRPVLWACVEAGFHVGSRAGEFLGFADEVDGGLFRAFNAHAAVIGEFATLHEATQAIERAGDALNGRVS